MKKVKRVKIKIKFKNILWTLLILFLIGMFVYLIINKKINNIYIEGNKVLTEQEIMELSGFDDYKKYYQISTKNIVKRLKTSPFIKDAKVKKTFLSLTIKVLEYDVLWYQEYDESVMLANSESVYVEKSILGIPIVINQVNDEYISEFIEKMQKIDKDILRKISEITYEPSELDKERFLLYMNDQNYVYLTLSKFEYINKYNELLPELDGKKGILYLDSGNHFEIKK